MVPKPRLLQRGVVLHVRTSTVDSLVLVGQWKGRAVRLPIGGVFTGPAVLREV
jgi:hypothetical protein